MSEGKPNPFPETPKEHEPWVNEGGTARYPEGYRFRGHDMNALLDRADGIVPTSEDPEDDPGDKQADGD